MKNAKEWVNFVFVAANKSAARLYDGPMIAAIKIIQRDAWEEGARAMQRQVADNNGIVSEPIPPFPEDK